MHRSIIWNIKASYRVCDQTIKIYLASIVTIKPRAFANIYSFDLRCDSRYLPTEEGPIRKSQQMAPKQNI